MFFVKGIIESVAAGKEKNVMSEEGKYRGRLWTAAVRVLVYGVLIGFVLQIIAIGPVGIVWGIFMSAGIVFFRRTTVEIEGEEICISGTGRKERFLLSQFAYPSIRRKTYIGSYSKFTAVKCYFIFITSDGYKRCRLYGFGEKDLERALEAVRKAQAEHMTDEEKAAIVKEYSDEVSEALIQGREGENEFQLPASVLMKKERKYLRKISLIMVGIVCAVAMLDVKEIFVNRTFSMKLVYMTLLAFMLLVCVIVMYAGLIIRRGLCGERIVIDGDHLKVGGDYYSYSCIETIRLTSPRKRSSSVFPVQRYMYVSAGGRTKKYWLGSEVSFREYESLCGRLEQGMILSPAKIRYL